MGICCAMGLLIDEASMRFTGCQCSLLGVALPLVSPPVRKLQAAAKGLSFTGVDAASAISAKQAAGAGGRAAEAGLEAMHRSPEGLARRMAARAAKCACAGLGRVSTSLGAASAASAAASRASLLRFLSSRARRRSSKRVASSSTCRPRGYRFRVDRPRECACSAVAAAACRECISALC